MLIHSDEVVTQLTGLGEGPGEDRFVVISSGFSCLCLSRKECPLRELDARDYRRLPVCQKVEDTNHSMLLLHKLPAASQYTVTQKACPLLESERFLVTMQAQVCAAVPVAGAMPIY